MATVLLVTALGPAQVAWSAKRRAVPTPQQRAWQDLEMGMFIHFAPNTWQDKEYDDLSTPLAAINPRQLDTDQWVETAVKMGARYIVFVAKHAGGFCMWRTNTTDYGIKNTPWRGGKGDVLADLAASCKKRGLKLGVYLSPRDDRQGAALGGKCKTPGEQRAYNALYRRQLVELLTRYGSMVEIWFDGSLVVPVRDILKRFAPRAMIFQGRHATIRWVGNEDGFAPYPAWNATARRDARTGISTAMHGDPDGDVWLPNEVDVSLRRPNWFWNATNENQILSLDQLMEIYYRSVGRGANLLINVTPDRSGLIPSRDVARAEEFGAELRRRFETAIGETSGRGHTVGFELRRRTRIDHAILMEDTRGGERVREYVLEGLSGDRWVEMGRGSAIGHKRIQALESREVSAVRVRCLSASAKPLIRRAAVFSAEIPPPRTWNDPAKVWADDEAGRWSAPAFDLDLTKRIDAPGQYRLRFVPDGGAAFAIDGFEALFDGIAQADLLRLDTRRRHALILTVPGLGKEVHIRGRISGARAGTVLVQKL